ncbi:MAG TPA: DUF192 domain-containing protein [Anaerolineae bacterium]|nr:DUF192 domain-containing protein [Anaerolineae bacterium]
MKYVKVLNAQNETLLMRVKWCDTFASRLRGLSLRRPLAPDEGLLLVEPRAGIAATSIHMFFVNFAIAAIWLDNDRRVVHTALAQPWRPYYGSPQPARYVLEAPPELLKRVAVGDSLRFEEQTC